MFQRLSLWLVLFAFIAVGAAHAQTSAPTPAAAPAAMPPGRIQAKQVQGKVSMTLNGVTSELHNDDFVSQLATIVTQNESSVILVFSNGATTQLGADTTLVIEQFLQDPFGVPTNMGALENEPTRSKTKLHLTKGELVGKVAHLNHEAGSEFTVQTPVGAAGIRGTTFRIVFRPTGTGQAFAVFSLSTVEGNVNFQGGAPGTPGQPPPGTPPTNGVPVVGGQEVVVTVEVNVNAQGVAVVSAPPTITSTQPISADVQQQIVQQAQVMATTAASTTFTPPPATSGGQSAGTGSTDGTTSSSTSSTSSTTSTSSTGSTSGTGSTTPTGSTQNPPPSPGPTSTPPQLTPGAGKQ